MFPCLKCLAPAYSTIKPIDYMLKQLQGSRYFTANFCVPTYKKSFVEITAIY